MDRADLVDEHVRADRLAGRDRLAEDRLDLVLATAEGDDEIRMIVEMKVDALARVEPHLPHADVLVLEQQRLADRAELDAAFPRGFESMGVHLSQPGRAGSPRWR